MRTKKKPTPVRTPETDPLRIAKSLEAHLFPGTTDTDPVTVPRYKLDEAVAALRRPPIEHPVPHDVINLWDKLDGALNRVITALPFQMTGAVENLEAVRLAFRTLIQQRATGR